MVIAEQRGQSQTVEDGSDVPTVSGGTRDRQTFDQQRPGHRTVAFIHCGAPQMHQRVTDGTQVSDLAPDVQCFDQLLSRQCKGASFA